MQTRPDILPVISNDHGVVGAVLLPEEYSPIHTWGSFYFLHWKKNLTKVATGMIHEAKAAKII